MIEIFSERKELKEEGGRREPRRRFRHCDFIGSQVG